MKKGGKKIITISFGVLATILATCLLISTIACSAGFGLLFFSSGGLTKIAEKVGYTTPFVFQTESEFSKDAVITNDILFSEIERILKNYDCEHDEVKVYDNEWGKFYTIINEHDDVGSGKVLYVYSLGNIGINLNKHNDIKAMMDIWLFVTEYQVVENFDGICYWFLKTGKMARATEINISMHQFEIFYTNADVDDLPHKEKIDILTDIWVKKVNYTRPNNVVNVKPMVE